MKGKFEMFGQVLFWTWNVLFLLLIHLGLMPVILPGIIENLAMGSINPDVALFFFVTLFTPIMAIIAAFVLKRDGRKLFELMYIIEIPLLILTLFRVFCLRELTTGSGFFLTVFIASSLYSGYRLFSRRGAGTAADLTCATTVLCCGIWVFLLLALFIPPLAALLAQAVVELIRHPLSVGDISVLLVLFFPVLIGLVFALYSLTLFLFFPVVYVRAAYRTFKETFHPLFRVDPRKALVTASATAALLTAAFVFTTQQNHAEVLSRLESFSGTEKELREIAREERRYRKTLRDVYLAPYRYLGDAAHTNFLEEFYRRTLHLESGSARAAQSLFNQVARPFIFQGSSNGMAHDQALAEKLYTKIYDASLQEEERESIRHAIKATYSREQISAGLLNIDDERVHLESQDLTLKEEGEWADLELHETYFNPSLRPEEVFLHFKLPESAVITDAWLSDDETKKFRARVSPRGAAQKVYQKIVAQGEDPALIEEVGPSLYRLRVFPIPANRASASEKKRLHLWLGLRLLKENDATWPLPQLIEKRNLYWDADTKFVVNGAPAAKEASWLPRELPQTRKSSPLTLRSSIGGRNIEIAPFDETTLKARCRFTVVIDPSYSMREHREELLRAKEAIDQSCDHQGVTYFTWKNGPVKVEGSIDEALAQQSFAGTFDDHDLVQHFPSLDSEKDAVIVLTDRSFFRESFEYTDYTRLSKPTWFLLLDSRYPRSLDDHLMKRLYAIGGGLETSWPLIARSIARARLRAAQHDGLAVSERYIFRYPKNEAAPSSLKPAIGSTGSTAPTPDASDTSSPQTALLPLLTHTLILHAISEGRAKDVDDLGELHKLAVGSHIVSPFSSFIILVDRPQDRLLEEAERESDRFDRKVETGKEVLSHPTAPFETTAVPEPEEWALIIAAFGVALIERARRHKLAMARL